MYINIDIIWYIISIDIWDVRKQNFAPESRNPGIPESRNPGIPESRNPESPGARKGLMYNTLAVPVLKGGLYTIVAHIIHPCRYCTNRTYP